MSFREYIATRQARGNPQGDFLRDARADHALPDAKSWAELRSYLRRQRAIPEAIDAARLVWQSYEARRRFGAFKN
jgi:hypothetical protein